MDVDKRDKRSRRVKWQLKRGTYMQDLSPWKHEERTLNNVLPEAEICQALNLINVARIS